MLGPTERRFWNANLVVDSIRTLFGSSLPSSLPFLEHDSQVHRIRQNLHLPANRWSGSAGACPEGGGLLRRVPGAGQHPGQGKAATSTSGGAVVSGERRRTGGVEVGSTRQDPGGGGVSSPHTPGAGSPCPNPGRTGEYEGPREVRPGADRTAVWFGGGGAVADSGTHLGVDPAPQGNWRQPWRSSQNQPREGASGAASSGGGVLLSIDQEPDRHRAGNHSPNNRRSRSGRLLTGAVAAGLLFSPTAALAHHQPTTGETCRAFRYEETYVPGYTNGNGRWVKGGIQLRKERIACAPGGYGVAHAPHHYGHPAPYPVPYPQQQQQAGQPIVVNGPAPQRCGGTLARMGLGGILGGVAGFILIGLL